MMRRPGMRPARRPWLLIGIILLAPALASADAKRVKGHVLPLPSELLQQPVRLSCGVVIREWRGFYITDEAKQRVERLCNKAAEHFVPFMKKRGYQVEKLDVEAFYFQYALLPNNREYRSLNDVKWRFYDRPWRFPVWGWTSHTDEWVFMLGNFWNPEFDNSFVHETFHALSLKTGTFEQHPGKYYKDKEHVDERLAVQFTADLGHGR